MGHCTSVKDLSEPPAVSANISYLVGVTPEGETVIMDTPVAPGIVLFTGTGYTHADGSSGAPLKLSALQIANHAIAYNGIAFIDSDGEFYKGSNPTSAEMILVSQDGGVQWKAAASGLPLTGSGFLNRTVAGDVAWGGLTGLQYIGADSEPDAIPNGTVGQILTLRTINGEVTPQWEAPQSGNLAQGSGVAGLEGLRAESLGQEQVNIIAPTMKLTDGTNDIDVANVNVTLDLTAPVGLLGLDTGAENSNKWYYGYITSDGVGDIKGIISEDPDAPDLSGTTHSYWAFATVFRNDGSGNIVEYSQRGRRIQTIQQNLVSHGTVTTAFTNITPTNPWNTLVPPMVKTVSGIVGGDGTAPAETAQRTMIMASTISGIGTQFIGSRENGVTVLNFRYDAGCFYDMIIDDPTSPTLAWRSNANTNRRRLDITGYTI